MKEIVWVGACWAEHRISESEIARIRTPHKPFRKIKKKKE